MKAWDRDTEGGALERELGWDDGEFHGWDDHDEVDAEEPDDELDRARTTLLLRVARKPYECASCGLPIARGDRYADALVYQRGHRRTCIRCYEGGGAR